MLSFHCMVHTPIALFKMLWRSVTIVCYTVRFMVQVNHLVWVLAQAADLIHTSNYMKRSHVFQVNMHLGIHWKRKLCPISGQRCHFTEKNEWGCQNDTLISSTGVPPISYTLSNVRWEEIGKRWTWHGPDRNAHLPYEHYSSKCWDHRSDKYHKS